ncbi:hypothetical protein TNCT_333021 [Trichonephila clavata]|uniref:Uncharacterized protein n=1 Tax=Trichonephila clavata TaxID=2740835 RepID=A0A8X6I1P4_TRICU|nr:hypothetical protein TNCT_333021 [Trichonephila clavata]
MAYRIWSDDEARQSKHAPSAHGPYYGPSPFTTNYKVSVRPQIILRNGSNSKIPARFTETSMSPFAVVPSQNDAERHKLRPVVFSDQCYSTLRTFDHRIRRLLSMFGRTLFKICGLLCFFAQTCTQFNSKPYSKMYHSTKQSDTILKMARYVVPLFSNTLDFSIKFSFFFIICIKSHGNPTLISWCDYISRP